MPKPLDKVYPLRYTVTIQERKSMSDPTTKIRKSDLPRLKAFAEARGLKSRVEAITAMLDFFEMTDKIPSLEFTGEGNEIDAAFKKGIK